MSPPSVLLNSLKILNSTTHRCSRLSHRIQCLNLTLRNVGGSGIRLQPEQFLHVNRLALPWL